MNLYIHIGTEKTGSSFLQNVCAINRDWLAKSGFFFPKAGRDEKRLKTGTISPGNAKEFAKLINTDAWNDVSDWLEARVRGAQFQSCQNLLLSHELLFASLAREGVMGEVARCLNRLGIDRVSLLLFIRDPVDHAISLYKHRGKNGNIGSIEKWMHDHYSTATDLADFMRHDVSDIVSLYTRKYQKRPNALVESFFCDWLGTDIPPQLLQEVVNPSLTLSEIEVLKHVAAVRPEVVDLLYQSFLTIPRGSKASDKAAERSARLVAGNFLAAFNNTWRELGQLVEMDGGLEIPVRQRAGSGSEGAFSLSGPQLRAIVESHKKADSPRYRLFQILNAYVRVPLGRLKRLFLS